MTRPDPLARPDKESPNVLADGAWVMRDRVLVWEPAATPREQPGGES